MGDRLMIAFLFLHVYDLAVKVTVYSDFGLLRPQTGKFPRRFPTQKLFPAAAAYACGKRNEKFNFWGQIGLFIAPFRRASISWATY